VLPPIVDAAWLTDHRDELVLADVRLYFDGRSEREAYDAGHLPGAVFVDLERDLSGAATPATGRHPLPAPDAFAAAMSALGIGDDDTVVGYDDAGGVIAARLVWMLRALGRRAALLDGGLQAWRGPLETEPAARPRARFTPAAWPERLLASADDAADPANLVLDARQRERYLGAPDALDPRAGHIPGAGSLPCREHLDAAGRVLPVDDLRRRLAGAGVTDAAPVVSYCGSGVTACHNLLVLEHAGLGRGRLYPGSWSQWSRDPARPAETGPAGRPALRPPPA
jgi:thiosulfate/3-mercaptopyruvate sulfurtransferase